MCYGASIFSKSTKVGSSCEISNIRFHDLTGVDAYEAIDLRRPVDGLDSSGASARFWAHLRGSQESHDLVTQLVLGVVPVGRWMRSYAKLRRATDLSKRCIWKLTAPSNQSIESDVTDSQLVLDSSVPSPSGFQTTSTPSSTNIWIHGSLTATVPPRTLQSEQWAPPAPLDRQVSSMSNMEAQATSVPAIHDQVQKSKEKSSLLGRAWDKYESGVGKLAGWVSRGSGNLGSLISKRPMMTLVLSIIISILICLGWMRFGMENESDKLWVPNNSKAIEDRDVVESQYPRGQSGASLYAQDKADPTSNALLIPITWEIFKVHAKILAIEVDGETNGSRVTYAQICNKDFNGDCRNSGYLNYFGYSFDQFISAIDGSYTDPTVGNATAFVEITSQTKYPDGKSISMLSLYGGVVFNYSPFSVASAQVIAVDYPMDGDVSDGVAESW
eukprot:gene7446-586_t